MEIAKQWSLDLTRVFMINKKFINYTILVLKIGRYENCCMIIMLIKSRRMRPGAVAEWLASSAPNSQCTLQVVDDGIAADGVVTPFYRLMHTGYILC